VAAVPKLPMVLQGMSWDKILSGPVRTTMTYNWLCTCQICIESSISCFTQIGHIGQECHVLADKVPESFLKTQVLCNDAEPPTSWSQDGSQAIVIPMVHSCEADISGLTLFCSQCLGWVPLILHQKFKTYMWPRAF
jgi:hypothetical protein